MKAASFALLVLIALRGPSPLHAQISPPSAPAAAAVDPTRLPGDRPPDTIDRMLQLPRPHPPQPIDATPGPGDDLALEAARTAIANCSAKGFHVGAAVVDSAGNLRVGLSAAGAAPGRIYTAVQKDLAAMAWKRPTSEVQILLRGDRASLPALYKPNMVVVPGGIPLIVGNMVIGAVAVSGATGDQDELCAIEGARRIHDRLR